MYIWTILSLIRLFPSKEPESWRWDGLLEKLRVYSIDNVQVWDCGVGPGLAQRLSITRRSKVRDWSRAQLPWVLYLHIGFLSSSFNLHSDLINLEAHPWPNRFFFPRWSWFTLNENEQLWLPPAPSVVNSERAHEQRQQLPHQWAPSQILLFLPIALHGQSMDHPATDPYLRGSGLGNSRRSLLLRRARHEQQPGR